MDWVDVVDSAVKIGLGALVGGVFSLLTLRLSHTNERRKELRTHRIKVIEDIASKVDEFFNAHMQLLSKIAWYSEALVDKKQSVQVEFGAAIRKCDDRLLSASDGIRVAVARLRLLGASECVAEIRSGSEFVMNFRNECAGNEGFPSPNEVDAHRVRVNDLQERVHRGLHKIYCDC